MAEQAPHTVEEAQMKNDQIALLLVVFAALLIALGVSYAMTWSIILGAIVTYAAGFFSGHSAANGGERGEKC